MSEKIKVAVLVSGGGTNLQALIDKEADGQIPDAHIVKVIASREDAFALERAAEAGIETAVAKKNLSRLWKNCRKNTDMIVLAGLHESASGRRSLNDTETRSSISIRP